MVDLPHHLRRLLVALAVNVPQHQDRPSPGELLGEEPPEAAPSAGDHAHLSRDALLLGPHHPLGPGRDEGPEHFENDHEELRDDDHHLGSTRASTWRKKAGDADEQKKRMSPFFFGRLLAVFGYGGKLGARGRETPAALAHVYAGGGARRAGSAT